MLHLSKYNETSLKIALYTGMNNGNDVGILIFNDDNFNFFPSRLHSAVPYLGNKCISFK